MRYTVIANDEREGWDVIDTQEWTSDVEDERENPVVLTIWDGSMVDRVLGMLNGIS